MSSRPPFPPSNSTFPSRFNNHFFSGENNPFACKSREKLSSNFTNYDFKNSPNAHPNLPLTTFRPRMYGPNKLNLQCFPPNQYYNTLGSSQRSMSSVPFSYQSSVHTFSNSSQNSTLVPPNFIAPCNPLQQNNRNLIPHGNQNFSGQSVANCGLSPVVNFQGYQNNSQLNAPPNTSSTPFNHFLQNSNIGIASNMTVSVDNTIPLPEIGNDAISAPVNCNVSTVQPLLPNLSQGPPPQWNNSFFQNVPPPVLGNVPSCVPSPVDVHEHLVSEKEKKLVNFLQRYTSTQKKSDDNKITVPEFRSMLKAAFSIMKLLSKSKSKLTSLISASEDEWNSELDHTKKLKKQLSEICSIIISRDNLDTILKKLKFIKRKRDQKKKTKLNKLAEKIKAEQSRKELNTVIDKWLDDIKEKNLKLKREVEMKKEADFILLEVRRKIQEANRTIEKIKVFDKLRNARQATAAQKGLRILPEHNENFAKKVIILKETMLRQLADYEAEEKALKVMLETEQEGQMEEKAQWELKRLKTLQQKRQNHIIECLFGNSEDPLPTDTLYLFHKYHTSANNSIENLVQIRHQWDVFIAEDGETVPQQWIVPTAPSDSSWEMCLKT